MTKEQIIAEGWFHNHDDFTFGRFTRKGYELWYDYKYHSLDIDRVDSDEVHTDLYDGECVDIDDFRSISKRINIK